MQFRSRNPDTDITDLDRQPGSTAPYSDEPEPVLDLKYSISMSLDHDPPETDPSMLPQPTFLWPFKFLYHIWKSDTHLNNTNPTLLNVFNRYSVIGSYLFLWAFFIFRKSSHNRTSLQVFRDAFARKVLRFFVFLCLKVALRNRRRQDRRRFRRK